MPRNQAAPPPLAQPAAVSSTSTPTARPSSSSSNSTTLTGLTSSTTSSSSSGKITTNSFLQMTARTIPGTTHPVTPISSSPIAKIYNIAHPFVVLLLLVVRFGPLVNDPVAELATSWIPLSGLQVAYCAFCLPVAKGGAKEGKTGTAARRGESKAAGPLEKIIPATIATILAAVLGMPIVFIILILFGAPLTTHTAHTVLAAAHISSLTLIPLIYVHGVHKQAWWEVLALLLPFDDVWGGSLGACFGAWLGAVPIPLDWDRPWQAWPITIVTGAYIGFAIGKVIGGTLLKGKRLRFSADDETEVAKKQN